MGLKSPSCEPASGVLLSMNLVQWKQERNHLQRKKKRKPQRVVTEDDDTVSLDGHDEDEESRKQKWTRKQLLPHIGRTAIEIVTSDIELMFEWKIGFDWTGEVESLISASARLPKSCTSPHSYQARGLAEY